ncbi:MAG: succinate dehydrogenase, hydrophobic membrane anchor protein [Pseudomonadota bacterium]
MAHKPTSTFAAQRVSAIVITPLALWFLFSLALNAGNSLGETQAWLSQLHNKALFGLFVTVGVFHGRIGLHEIIEDYIHGALNELLNAAIIASAIAIAGATWVALFMI